MEELKIVVIAKDLETLKNYLEELDIEITGFQKPDEGFEYIIKNKIDFILIDYDEIEDIFFELVKKIEFFSESMVILVTSNKDPELKLKALESGVIEFINKPIIKAELLATIRVLAKIKFQQMMLENEKILIQSEVQRQIEKIKKQEKEILEVLAHVAEYRDENTFLHVKRVAEYSKILAEALNFSKNETELIYQAAPLHDIGKIGVRDSVLLKDGKLTKEEFEHIKNHTILGYEILRHSSSPILKMGATIALTHHERWDGKGYPYGLKGENISIYGRIVSIVDVFDALTAKRVYKAAWNLDKAFKFIEENKEVMFDPILVDKFLSVKEEIIYYYNHSEQEIKNETFNNRR